MSVWTEMLVRGAAVLWHARSASHGWRSSRDALGRSLGTLQPDTLPSAVCCIRDLLALLQEPAPVKGAVWLVPLQAFFPRACL